MAKLVGADRKADGYLRMNMSNHEVDRLQQLKTKLGSTPFRRKGVLAHIIDCVNVQFLLSYSAACILFFFVFQICKIY